MATPFSFTWTRARDGYEIRRRGNQNWIFPRSHNRETYTLQRQDELAFARIAASARTIDGVMSLATLYGLPHEQNDGGEPVYEWQRLISLFKGYVENLQREHFAALARAFNDPRLGRCEIRLRAAPGDQRPSLEIVPEDLEKALLYQLAAAVSGNLQFRYCGRCNTPFKFGPGTGRRKTAIYCSPKCQKADAYQKAKEHTR